MSRPTDDEVARMVRAFVDEMCAHGLCAAVAVARAGGGTRSLGLPRGHMVQLGSEGVFVEIPDDEAAFEAARKDGLALVALRKLMGELERVAGVAERLCCRAIEMVSDTEATAAAPEEIN